MATNVPVLFRVYIFIFLVLLVGCNDSSSSRKVDLVKANYEKWLSSGTTNYSMQYRLSCFCELNGVLQSIVIDQDTTLGENAYSIEKIFQLIMESIVSGETQLYFEFNELYGYPKYVEFVDKRMLDSNAKIEVVKLIPL